MNQQARLYIDDVEIIDFDNVNITVGGNNTINKLTCVITDPEYSDAQILDSDIKFFLNYGCSEETPFFRGVIRNYTPSDKQVSISALDPRVLITGKTSPLLSITDKNNYDGYTVSQFLQETIEEKINHNKTRIGLNFLNEPYPAIRMKGIRGVNKAPYDFAKEAIQKSENLNIDNEAYGEVNQWRMTMIDDGAYNNIVFYKEQSINGQLAKPAVTVSYNDNLQKYSYKIRPVPSILVGTTESGENRTYIDGNTPTGILSKQIKGKFNSTADIHDAALRQISMESVEFAEANIEVGKLAYHALGDTIRLNVPEEELHNVTHRIKSKKISYSHSKGTKISIGLNKDREIISEYLKI